MELKEVTLLAMGDTRIYCPFNTETWSLNNGYRQLLHCYKCKDEAVALEISGDKLKCPKCSQEYTMPRIDKIFLAHTQCWDAEGDAVFNWADFNYLAARGVEIINTHRVSGLKATIYPMKAILRKFKRNYFSDTIAYQIAYALYKGYDKINFYGADMHTYSEYAKEKGGLEYWIGRAEERGVEIYIHPDSSVCTTANRFPYGVNIRERYCWMDDKGVEHEVKIRHKRPDFKGLTPNMDKILVPRTLCVV